MRKISRQEWETKKRHGYASIICGDQRAILTLDKATGATVLEPVEVEGLHSIVRPGLAPATR